MEGPGLLRAQRAIVSHCHMAMFMFQEDYFLVFPKEEVGKVENMNCHRWIRC